MTTSQSGLHVVLSADQAGTGKMLEGELNRLKQSLEEAGVQISQLSVGQDRANRRSSQDPNPFRKPSGKSNRLQALSGVDEKGNQSVSRSSIRRSLVDCQV